MKLEMLSESWNEYKWLRGDNAWQDMIHPKSRQRLRHPIRALLRRAADGEPKPRHDSSDPMEKYLAQALATLLQDRAARHGPCEASSICTRLVSTTSQAI